MVVNFLHGVESLYLDNGPRPVTVVKSAVIGIVGIAPKGPINTPTLVTGDTLAAQFGKAVPGFNIPQALNAIFKQGAGTVVVVNVFDAAENTAAVTAEAHTLVDRKTKLSFAPIGDVTITNADNSPSTLVKDTDYTLDEYGNFVGIKSTVTPTMALKFTYDKLDASTITASLLIGDVDGSGNRTGMQAWSLAKNLFGFNPKILIAPAYSHLTSVAAEMISQATALKAVALLDAPAGTTVAQAIAGRGISGSINFNTSSKRAFLLYPYLKAYDAATDSNVDTPYSQFMAGVIASTDNELGYWFSPSNKEIKGIVGAERNISASLNDAGSDANTLNEAGITTIFNTFGTGIRTWGNRNASFPTSTAPDNFINILRTADVVSESVENSILQYIDKPITQALIDAIRESCNAFIRILIGRGALIAGSRVEFPKDVNTPVEIAAGHLTYDVVMMPPPPFERGTFRYFLDISLLKNLG
jgi:phage tail sheath protein FI